MAEKKQNSSVELSSASLGLEKEEEVVVAVVVQETLTIEKFCKQFEKNDREYGNITSPSATSIINGQFKLSNEIVEKAACDFLTIVKNDDNILRDSLEYFNKCALASTTQAQAMAFLFSSKIMENRFDLKNIKIRNRMLDILQINFKNSVDLKQQNVNTFYNSITLLGEYYHKVRNIENQPIFILHDALMELLAKEVIWQIEQHSMDCDFIVDEQFTNLLLNQLALNGSLIKKYNKRIIENIYLQLRRLLIKVDNLTKDSKANILKAIDLYCNNFQQLNDPIERFYQNRLYDLSLYDNTTDEARDENDQVHNKGGADDEDQHKDTKSCYDENKFNNDNNSCDHGDGVGDEKDDTTIKNNGIDNGKEDDVEVRNCHDLNNTDNNTNINELRNLKQLKSDIIECNKTMRNSLYLKSAINGNDQSSIIKLALFDKPLSLNKRIKFIQNNSIDIEQENNSTCTKNDDKQKPTESNINEINCRRKTTTQHNNNNINNKNEISVAAAAAGTSSSSTTGESSKQHSNKSSSPRTANKTQQFYNQNYDRNKTIKKLQTINNKNNIKIDLNDKSINNRMKVLQLSSTTVATAVLTAADLDINNNN